MTPSKSWPSDRGPVQSLVDLGRIKPGHKPSWVNDTAVTEHREGDEHPTYVVRLRRLGPGALADLQALFSEGWMLRALVDPPHIRIEVHVND